jgi:septal ring factor EnvC (AmiA/AmiB activator)
MNQPNTQTRRGDGIGCECCAHSVHECGCPDADWTPSEVYELQDQLDASKAEVESLKKELDAWDYGTRAKREQEARKKAEAEVAKLNHQLLKTESDLLQSQDINSFLDAEFRIACKRAEKAEEQSESRRQSLAFALNEIKKADAEVERLKLLLSDLLILTEKNYWNSSNYNQIKEKFNTTAK